jgi:hypothetical protein
LTGLLVLAGCRLGSFDLHKGRIYQQIPGKNYNKVHRVQIGLVDVLIKYGKMCKA